MSFASVIASTKTSIQKFARDETGATAIEYGLIAGLISVVILTILGTIGTDLKAIFTTIENRLATASTST
jgi:pilus assembly protein Flp/PilA